MCNSTFTVLSCTKHTLGIEPSPYDALCEAILAKLAAEAALPVDIAISRLERAASPPQSMEITLSDHMPTMTTCSDTLDTFYNAWLALPVPPMSQLLQLSKALFDDLKFRPISQWLSLKLSYRSEITYLPTWVIKPWQHLQTMLSHCHAWKAAKTKLADYMRGPQSLRQLAKEASEWIRPLPFDSPLPQLVDLRTSNLPTLIHHGWLSEDHINAGVDLINNHPKCPSNLRVLNSYFIRHLELSFERHHKWVPGSWSALDRELTRGAICELLIPIHRPSHWTQLYINLETKCYAYSDTLNLWTCKAPSGMIKLVDKWLSGILNDNITLRPSSRPFKLGPQSDSNSCGVAVLSSLAHYALGGEFIAWAQADSEQHRLRWTCRFFEYSQAQTVSKTLIQFAFKVLSNESY